MRTSTSTLALFALSCAADLDPVQVDLPDTGTLLPAATAASSTQHSSELLALVAADRRQLQAAGPGHFTAHPRFGLSAELTAQGLRASAREDSVFLTTVAYGNEVVGGAEPELGGCALGDERVAAACVRQVELDHGGLTEWWVSRADGLEHGWTLHAPPEDGTVSITVALSLGEVLEVDDDGLGASLVGSAGGLWRYDGLVAWDADGVSLPARLVDNNTHLTVEVDATGARWPLTVDPALSTATKITASDGAAGDQFGISVSGAGDVNSDGYDDVVVGASLDDGADSGSAYVYYGSATGIDLATEDKLNASDGEVSDYYGRSVSGAGDLNGDGYGDVVVGANGDDDNGESSGSVYVYYGSATGIDANSEEKLTASDGAASDVYGTGVASAGDVNGDGYDDLVVGACSGDGAGTAGGAAYVYYGSASGIDTASEDKVTASDRAAADYFGRSVAGAGDIDGDGYADLVVGARGDDDNGSDSGSAYVYYGSAAGIDLASEDKLTASDGSVDDYYGRSVSGAGDLDGDGYADLVVGAHSNDDNGAGSGAAYVYYGSPTGIDGASEDKLIASDGATNDYFGWSMSGAGDLDGDGYDDLVVGAYKDDATAGDSAYVYFGSAAGVDSDSEDKLTGADPTADDHFGISVSGAGDVDGDGYDDLVVGARGDDEGGSYTGAAYVYEGGCRDGDGDGYACNVDCDDSNASTYPGAAEGESTSDCMTDNDGDGYGDDSPASGVTAGTDCDDSDAASFPGGTEAVGDEVDADCDGTETCYVDNDDDGYTDGATTVASTDTDCTDAGEGLATDNTGECDDTDATIHPGATEVEDDGIDQDCDGEDNLGEVADSGDGGGDAGDGGAEDGGSGTGGCRGCASTMGPSTGAGAWLLLGLLLVSRRRRH
jgi:uncharacterized protein (TIGR03382 family)